MAPGDSTYHPSWWVTPVVDFSAGTIGGFIGKVIEFPFDTLKVQLQTRPGHTLVSPVHHLRSVLNDEGAFSLYRGLPLPLFGSMIETACLFTTMGQVKSALYGDRKEITSGEICLAGGISGLLISFILTPIELVKCRMQASQRAHSIIYKSSADCFIRSIREEGYSVLYKGHKATMLREIPGTAAWFATYDMCQKYLDSNSDKKSPYSVIMAGAFSGVAYNAAFFPADTVKSRLQTMPHSHTRVDMINIVFQMYRSKGLRGFYQGLTPTIIRAVPANAAVFYCYEELTKTLESAANFWEL